MLTQLRAANCLERMASQTADAGPSCLLCYEADWRCCHRRRVAEILAERHGFRIAYTRIKWQLVSHL